MSSRRKLELDVIREKLAGLEGWSLVDGKLHREFRFADFNQAFSFMTRVALVAEQLDHHPEWRNVYNRVVVDLITHDAGGISQYDFDLAGRMDAFGEAFSAR